MGDGLDGIQVSRYVRLELNELKLKEHGVGGSK